MTVKQLVEALLRIGQENDHYLNYGIYFKIGDVYHPIIDVKWTEIGSSLVKVDAIVLSPDINSDS